ncbi:MULTISPECIES: stage V sporulation protein AE [Aneurinibacillus]|uniref:Stage V sporulation protein AE n=1 Tax=Aneurinibacillus thermoaerophilus TaxID=143495 RepID=A0A1G7XND4_ANETH|nr:MULTISPECIES: stage V sporulation protein AE [Aneurinibacillus]AMA73658.1 stage V sporulation protein AE [Aneurinibacillus sp. XH2]MED0675060.1 stage V sporulation protein AE [Aneurinibacillus thermoaerophilus]MED0679539.1 stage V sporulation protein AE [Aneurinibacillus thermoaerophilus]MED0737461.1 stage V sporulation protein AE [Aneurinibacillus thermoaerophilus]MED0756312.1 stage V sporulation protein AE [Aneurinibacillus thermoaerophilus]
MQRRKRRIIIITDGDFVARSTVEEVARRIGGRCISRSAGNPTPLNGPQIVSLIKKAKHDPVLVMFDDNGDVHMGKGEEALYYVSTHPDIEVLGAIAVASRTKGALGVKVDICIDRYGRKVRRPVNKNGFVEAGSEAYIIGDTVDVLNMLQIPVIVGIGDIGKMKGRDETCVGCPVTLAAVKFILQKSGYFPKYSRKLRKK